MFSSFIDFSFAPGGRTGADDPVTFPSFDVNDVQQAFA
jgi:hypothetical protein